MHERTVQLGNNSTGLHRIKVDSFTQCGRPRRMKAGDSPLSAGVTRGPQLVTCGDGSVAADLLIILAGVRLGCRVRIRDDPRRISVRDGRPHLWHMHHCRSTGVLTTGCGRAAAGGRAEPRLAEPAHRAWDGTQSRSQLSPRSVAGCPVWMACSAAASIVTAQMTRVQPTN